MEGFLKEAVSKLRLKEREGVSQAEREREREEKKSRQREAPEVGKTRARFERVGLRS